MNTEEIPQKTPPRMSSPQPWQRTVLLAEIQHFLKGEHYPILLSNEGVLEGEYGVFVPGAGSILRPSYAKVPYTYTVCNLFTKEVREEVPEQEITQVLEELEISDDHWTNGRVEDLKPEWSLYVNHCSLQSMFEKQARKKIEECRHRLL